MRITPCLSRHISRITLFTRENCGLCSNAKRVLSNVWDVRPFEFREVDIIKSNNGERDDNTQLPSLRWRDLYEFDVPVIHISKTGAGEEQPSLSSEAVKLMHRFTEEDVQAKMNIVEGGPA